MWTEQIYLTPVLGLTVSALGGLGVMCHKKSYQQCSTLSCAVSSAIFAFVCYCLTYYIGTNVPFSYGVKYWAFLTLFGFLVGTALYVSEVVNMAERDDPKGYSY